MSKSKAKSSHETIDDIRNKVRLEDYGVENVSNLMVLDDAVSNSMI